MPNKPRPKKKTAKKLAKKTASTLDALFDQPSVKEDTEFAATSNPEPTELIEADDFNEFAPDRISTSSTDELGEPEAGPGADVALDTPVPLPLKSPQEQLKESQGPILVAPAASQAVAGKPVEECAKTDAKAASAAPEPKSGEDVEITAPAYMAVTVRQLIDAVEYLLRKKPKGLLPKDHTICKLRMQRGITLINKLTKP